MREIINANIGQAGVQLSSAMWELYCSEHNIDVQGRRQVDIEPNSQENLMTFFCPVSDTQYVPRALCIDLESSVLDEIRTGPYRRLFHPEMLISGNDDASSNFARGHFTLGKRMIDRVMGQIRKIAHTCDRLHGFLVTSSIAGGTGSGFQTLLLEKLAIEYAKQSKMIMTIYPSATMSTSTVEQYNSVLNNYYTVDFTDIQVPFDNQSCYEICQHQLEVEKPNYCNINRIMANILSSITVSMRYESSLNSDMSQIITNLVPYPRIHFPVVNSAPLISETHASHEKFSTIDLTRMLFLPTNQTIGINPIIGNYFSCCIQYRGLTTPRLVNDAIFQIKRNHDINFVDWCPTGFKVGICSQPPSYIAASSIAQLRTSVTMLANSSAFSQVLQRLCQKFDCLFSKRAFIHWYVGEGMEEGEFSEARDLVAFVITDYTSIQGNDIDTVDETQDVIDKEMEFDLMQANEPEASEIPTVETVHPSLYAVPSDIAVRSSNSNPTGSVPTAATGSLFNTSEVLPDQQNKNRVSSSLTKPSVVLNSGASDSLYSAKYLNTQSSKDPRNLDEYLDEMEDEDEESSQFS